LTEKLDISRLQIYVVHCEVKDKCLTKTISLIRPRIVFIRPRMFDKPKVQRHQRLNEVLASIYVSASEGHRFCFISSYHVLLRKQQLNFVND